MLFSFGLFPLAAFAEPKIVALSPDWGPSSGGTQVTIQVEGLLPGSVQVSFGRREADQVRRLGPSTLQAIAPPGEPGPVGVTVKLPPHEAGPAVFTYLKPQPVISELHPASAVLGSQGLILEIKGEHFVPAAYILFGEHHLPTTFLAPDRLKAEVPEERLRQPGTIPIVVVDPTPLGGSSAPVSFSVLNPTPSLDTFDPSSAQVGVPGFALTVRGKGFVEGSGLILGEVSLPTAFVSPSELRAHVPEALLAQGGDLMGRVVNPPPGGGASHPMPFHILPPPPPPPMPGRFIAFTSNRQGGLNHIFLLDREGGIIDPLEEANSTRSNDGYPSISADGRLIVFQSDRNRGQFDIFLFDRLTRTLDPLPEANHPEAFDGFPHLSPDGRFIVFESDRNGRQVDLFLFDLKLRTLLEVSLANDPQADDGLPSISR